MHKVTSFICGKETVLLPPKSRFSPWWNSFERVPLLCLGLNRMIRHPIIIPQKGLSLTNRGSLSTSSLFDFCSNQYNKNMVLFIEICLCVWCGQRIACQRRPPLFSQLVSLRRKLVIALTLDVYRRRSEFRVNSPFLHFCLTTTVA